MRLSEIENTLPRAPRDPNRPVYLRIGDWNPDNERSGNYAMGEIEVGLSVYDLDEHGQPIIPDEGEWAEDDFNDRMASDAPKYLVQGQHVGMGHDGEPLLNGVVVVGMWR